MKVSSLIQAAGVRPGAGRWVVEFGDEYQTDADSPRGEYLAVRQESRGVRVPRVAETPGKGPQTGGRIIKFRAREKVAGVCRILLAPSETFLRVMDWQDNWRRGGRVCRSRCGRFCGY